MLIQISGLSQTHHRDSTIYENLGYRLILYSDSDFIFKWKGTDIARIQGIGDDTMSYGKYVKYKNKAFYLYSSPDLMSNDLKVMGTETFTPNMKDTITITISSPYNTRLLYKEMSCSYLYIVRIRYKTDNITCLNDIILSSPVSSFSNIIKIENRKQLPIESIIIQIYPYLSPYSIGLYKDPVVYNLYAEYQVQAISANCFDIYLPQLTPYYCFHERFDAKEFEILNDCTIRVNKRMMLIKNDCKSKWRVPRRFMRIREKTTNPYINEYE
jgi:hypothetical protein